MCNRFATFVFLERVVYCGRGVVFGQYIRTTTTRHTLEFGGAPERELEKNKQETRRLGRSCFFFAFCLLQ